MRIVFLLLALAIAGCSHTSVQVNSGGGVSTTSSSASVGIRGGGSAATWLLIGIGLIAAGEYANRQRVGGAAPVQAPPSEFDKARRVNEQDCTQPIEDWSANLKCR